ncbi:MAG: tryptophan synthase subunit alpha [Actinomycetales bacterium]|nr:tryptophan synthase subunit alpha [Actinomycetales bacterium]
MMRLADAFSAARGASRAALIGYLPAGFPDRETAHELVRAMVRGGVGIVEVGMPYSDPVMDGPAIQRASDVSLAAGTTVRDAIDVVRTAAEAEAAACLMSYWNPIARYGLERFCQDFVAAAGTAVITPDLSPEEAADWVRLTDAHGIRRVFLVAPSSTEARLALVAGTCNGFVYAASMMGVTGNDAVIGQVARDLVARARTVTDLPVAVGLGIRSADQVRAVAEFADGVIVGSAFVRAVEEAHSPAAAVAAVETLARELSTGVVRGAATASENGGRE